MQDLNAITPRIYLAATRQNDGKTTTSLGLFSVLRQRLGRVGYIKPIGQRYVEIHQAKVDEDALLVNETYDVHVPLEAMSPIAVDPGFTRRYLEGGADMELEKKVREAFNRAAWEKNFIIIEGSGHAGVGSVFNLSNARAARILGSRAILVSQGGLGKPIDELSLNLALFEKHGVEVAGVVMNKVLPEKMEQMRDYAEKGLSQFGLKLLGLMPLNYELQKPTINQVREQLAGRLLSGERHIRRRVNKVVIGVLSSRNADIYMEPGTLIITAGDREDLLLAIMQACDDGRQNTPAGVVLTQGFLPQEGLLKLLASRPLPVIGVQCDSFTAATRINRMTVKTEPGDRDKIAWIEQLISQYVDVEAIMKASSPVRYPGS